MLLTRKTSTASRAIAADCHLSIAAEIRRFVAAGTRQLLVTSSGPGEGKSTVVSEVGRALARQPELRVVLVDTDQLRPSLHRHFGVDSQGGLGELIHEAYGLDLRGTLPADFGLGDWIELLQVQGRTGRLEVAEEGRSLVVTFIKGGIASITDRGAGAHQRLGSLLTDAGHLSPQRRDQALHLASESGEPLGEVALRMGFVESGPLQSALRAQFGERLQQVLAMRQPKCAFTAATERELGAAVTRDAAAAAGWTKQSGAMLMIRERLKQPFLARQLSAALKSTDSPNLKLVSCGRAAVNLLEGSGPAALRCILEHLAATFDVVLVDSPPVALGSPAEAISEMVGGTVLVVQADRFESAVIRRAKDRLEKRGARVLGVILNQVDLQQPDQSFHYYYLYYPTGGDGSPRRARSSRRRIAGATDATDGAGAERPPGVRERLEREAELESVDLKRGGSGRVLTLLLVLAIVLGAFFAIRFGPWSQPHTSASLAGHPGTLSAATLAAGAAGAPAANAPPGTQAPVAAPGAMPPLAPGDSTVAAPAALAAGAGESAAARTGRGRSSTPGASSARYVVSVGTFLQAERAESELRKVDAVTALSARVEKITENGEESFRVVVGHFTSHAAAVKAASDLMGTGEIREALVLPATGTTSN